jgi:hypothetical protein
MRAEVLMSVSMNIPLLRDVTLSGLAEAHNHFG